MPEDEGCYLQGGIPHTALHGKPGHFATDPAQHFTERSGWNTLETKHRLLEDWSPWFDPAKPGGGEPKPYTHLVDSVFPQLRAAGVDEATIMQLTHTNPFNAFAR